jgi:hypothetical protein
MFWKPESIMLNVYCFATHVPLPFSVIIFGIIIFFSAGMGHLHKHIAKLLHLLFVAFLCIVSTAFEACSLMRNGGMYLGVVVKLLLQCS